MYILDHVTANEFLERHLMEGQLSKNWAAEGLRYQLIIYEKQLDNPCWVFVHLPNSCLLSIFCALGQYSVGARSGGAVI